MSIPPKVPLLAREYFGKHSVAQDFEHPLVIKVQHPVYGWQRVKNKPHLVSEGFLRRLHQTTRFVAVQLISGATLGEFQITDLLKSYVDERETNRLKRLEMWNKENKSGIPQTTQD